MHIKPEPDDITPSVEEPDAARTDLQERSQAASSHPRQLDSLPGEALSPAPTSPAPAGRPAGGKRQRAARVDTAFRLRSEAMDAAGEFLLARRTYTAVLRRRAEMAWAGEALRLAYGNYEAALEGLLSHLISAGPGAGQEVEIELLKVESATLRASLWAKVVRFGPGSHEAGLIER